MSYDLSAEGARRTEIENSIEEILRPYRHVKRLSTFYVIHVESIAMSETIRQNMANLANQIPERLLFIISPLMEGGRYNGILTTGDWDELNNITSLD